eukprot:COSAG04_NODE_7546_length_1110_cov_1.357072_1_plen_269_part_01
MLAEERQTAYYGSFTSGGIDALPDNTHLMGDARLDRDFGVQLDGDGDYVSLDTSWRTTSYASDGTFAIALWFTKGSACLAGLGSNSFATLFSHMQVPDDESKSMVKIQFGCDSASEQSTVTTDGDLIRVWLTDADSNRAVFDVSMTAAREGGYITDEWVHIILAVSSTSVQVFLDGSLVNTPFAQSNSFGGGGVADDSRFGFPLAFCGGCESWSTTAQNRAFGRAGLGYSPLLTVGAPEPTPPEFRLGGFGMYESYATNREYNFTMWMA